MQARFRNSPGTWACACGCVHGVPTWVHDKPQLDAVGHGAHTTLLVSTRTRACVVTVPADPQLLHMQTIGSKPRKEPLGACFQQLRSAEHGDGTLSIAGDTATRSVVASLLDSAMGSVAAGSTAVLNNDLESVVPSDGDSDLDGDIPGADTDAEVAVPLAYCARRGKRLWLADPSEGVVLSTLKFPDRSPTGFVGEEPLPSGSPDDAKAATTEKRSKGKGKSKSKKVTFEKVSPFCIATGDGGNTVPDIVAASFANEALLERLRDPAAASSQPTKCQLPTDVTEYAPRRVVVVPNAGTHLSLWPFLR